MMEWLASPRLDVFYVWHLLRTPAFPLLKPGWNFARPVTAIVYICILCMCARSYTHIRTRYMYVRAVRRQQPRISRDRHTTLLLYPTKTRKTNDHSGSQKYFARETRNRVFLQIQTRFSICENSSGTRLRALLIKIMKINCSAHWSADRRMFAFPAADFYDCTRYQVLRSLYFS